MMPTFPSSPLKFRTAGFPQYGFKQDFSRDLQWFIPPYARPQLLTRLPKVGPSPLLGLAPNRPLSASVSALLTQRPLARNRVILSRSLFAYYGLIRPSRSLPSLSFPYGAGSPFWGRPLHHDRQVPYFYPLILTSVPRWLS